MAASFQNLSVAKYRTVRKYSDATLTATALLNVSRRESCSLDEDSQDTHQKDYTQADFLWG